MRTKEQRSAYDKGPHREAKARSHAKWYAKNRETQLDEFRKWYAKNKEARKISKRNWLIANRDKKKARFHRRREREKGVEVCDRRAMNILQQLIDAAPRLKCGICGKNMPRNDRTIDHIIPLVHGGTGHASNLRLVHKRCNSRKSTRLPHEFDGQHEMNFVRNGTQPNNSITELGNSDIVIVPNK